jgi:hypothetical protein
VATAFYQVLLDKGDYYHAYESSKPRDGTLSFYSNGLLVSRQVRPLMDKLADTEKHLRFLQYSQMGLWLIVIGELIAIMILMRGN